MQPKSGVFLISLLLLATSCTKPNFQLNYKNFKDFIVNKVSIEDVTQQLAPAYQLVQKEGNIWKFRDNSKAWEAIIVVMFDTSTRLVEVVTFTAQATRKNEYSYELKNELGFDQVESASRLEDDYILKEKNLLASILSSPYNALNSNVYFYSIEDITNLKDIIGCWYQRHDGFTTLKLNENKTFIMNYYDDAMDYKTIYGGFYLNNDTLALSNEKGFEKKFKYYKEEKDDNYYFSAPGFLFYKSRCKDDK